MSDIVNVKNISKTFKLSSKQRKNLNTKEKYKKAVDDISFSVSSGEVYGLLGPNGAGKTTTLRILATLLKPDKGDVYMDGISVIKDPSTVREKISFLTCELKLEEFFTPNYLFDFFAKLYGLTPDIIEVRKKELFNVFNVGDFADTKVGELSTGMKQKASLAISLVHDPDIVIFDEPTNGLDILTAKIVTDYLKKLKEDGKTIIISTHIFDLIEKICDRTGIIIDGKMVIEGNVRELCKERSLEEVFFETYYSVI